jgi:ATP synthase I chain
MKPSDEEIYRNAVARMLRIIAMLAGGGSLAFFVWRGWKWGAGFAFGAGVAWVNFLLLKKLTDSLGVAGPKPPSAGSAVFLGSRYLMLGAVVYATLRFTSISMLAAAIGLFVSLAAVLVEILFELVYARN